MTPTDAFLAARVMQRIERLARISDEPGRLTRVYGLPALRRAHDLVAGWMRAAGMTAREDAIGNLIGRYEGVDSHAKAFLLGSHLDTVRDAGRFDGVLGVLVALACVEKLRAAGRRLPFAVEVVSFADEEGTRFHTSYLGSRALVGKLTREDLRRSDAAGIPLARAIREFGGNPAALASARRDRNQLLGYAEVHIEQGPVLDEWRLPVGVVSGIAGQSRVEITFVGRAGHAGATPMNCRQDALMGAAHFIAGLERLCRKHAGLVATVGQVDAQPGASNVIPGCVRLTLDVRHAADGPRRRAYAAIWLAARSVAEERGLRLKWQEVQSVKAIGCSSRLTQLMTRAVAEAGVVKVCRLASGAGHDAAVMAVLTPVAMLFVRCREGISHHPDESVAPGDVRTAITVLRRFLESLASQES